MNIHTDTPRILRDDLIVQQPYPTDGRWYVQQVALMDMGRFMTEREAFDHATFLQSKTSS